MTLSTVATANTLIPSPFECNETLDFTPSSRITTSVVIDSDFIVGGSAQLAHIRDAYAKRPGGRRGAEDHRGHFGGVVGDDQLAGRPIPRPEGKTDGDRGVRAERGDLGSDRPGGVDGEVVGKRTVHRDGAGERLGHRRRRRRIGDRRVVVAAPGRNGGGDQRGQQKHVSELNSAQGDVPCQKVVPTANRNTLSFAGCSWLSRTPARDGFHA